MKLSQQVWRALLKRKNAEIAYYKIQLARCKKELAKGVRIHAR